MAQDIVPIQLGLTPGNLVTLWAPQWREDGEEWEAFLGAGDDLFAFPDAAHLAAFVRTADEHDLIDHPAWHVVPALSAGELLPDEDHQYDLVGVPELVAEDPDTWTVGELAETVAVLRSLADVCELETVHEVLDSAAGFALLPQGTLPFTGRDGERLWTELAEVVVQRWDEVLDAIEAVVGVPEVDAAALAVAQRELAEYEDELDDDDLDDDEDGDVDEEEDEAAEPELMGFWGEIGIDPVRIITGTGEFYTLRCYLGDEPVFLGRRGRIDVFRSPRALARFIAGEQAENDMASVSTWPEVVARANGGELEIDVVQDNTYVLTGIADDISEGPESVDPAQLEMAVELLTDAADWADDDSVDEALAPSESLGWLVSFVLRPDPTRLAPSPPFDKEESAWRDLVAAFEDRLQSH